MPDAALHFSDVTFGFTPGKPLFANLSCSLSNRSGSGKIIALMGPSGVGKTTFCDLALGVHRPEKGTISFEPVGANVAFIPQKGVIFDELSVIENISCLQYSKTLGGTFCAEKVESAVQSLGLVNVLQNGTSAAALSGGEAQRVMLARIQTIACDVLILDEPCSFLDNRVKDPFLDALRDTVDHLRLLALMVTHVWDEARLTADEVIFFRKSPGEPVALHWSSVTDAQSRPPTLDALFDIHWPDCVILDYLQATSKFGTPSTPIPPSAYYVGMFRDVRGQTHGDEWAHNLWTEAYKSFEFAGTSKSRSGEDILKTTNVVAVYYDRNGVALR